MPTRIRSSFDRRSGVDRRKAYTVGYFLEGGTERRSGRERRCLEERIGWEYRKGRACG